MVVVVVGVGEEGVAGEGWGWRSASSCGKRARHGRPAERPARPSLRQQRSGSPCRSGRSSAEFFRSPDLEGGSPAPASHCLLRVPRGGFLPDRRGAPPVTGQIGAPL